MNPPNESPAVTRAWNELIARFLWWLSQNHPELLPPVPVEPAEVA